MKKILNFMLRWMIAGVLVAICAVALFVLLAFQDMPMVALGAGLVLAFGFPTAVCVTIKE